MLTSPFLLCFSQLALFIKKEKKEKRKKEYILLFFIQNNSKAKTKKEKVKNKGLDNWSQAAFYFLFFRVFSRVQNSNSGTYFWPLEILLLKPYKSN
jgi:hypothetical protein